MGLVRSQIVDTRCAFTMYCRNKSQLKSQRAFVAPALILFLLIGSSPAKPQSQQATPDSPPEIVRDSRYPAHWWKAVSKQGAPAWEILKRLSVREPRTGFGRLLRELPDMP